MAELATWLEKHKEQLVTQAVQQLSEREALRRQVEGPVRWFFDSLIEAIVQEQQKRLESLLRNWVKLCTVPINGEPVGILPVLGAFKRVLWKEFQADPPEKEPLALAAQLDGIIVQATEYLSRVEAAALMDEISHQLSIKQQKEALEDSKTDFIAVAGHELKTPLTVIEGYTNMLKLELPEASNPRAALMIRGVESGVERMRTLIENLIDVSLLETELFKLEYQPVWLRRVIDIARNEVREALKQRRITLTINQDTIPVKPTIADPEALLKAFQKVLENAIKYTPDGGKIEVSGRTLNNFIDIVIRDSGIGIAPEHIERIFEKFSPLGDVAHHSSGKFKFKGGGPGLGLVIAKGILESHGGTIWAESTGHNEDTYPGSAFHIMLPLRDVITGEGMSPLVASAMGSLVEHMTRESVPAVSAGEQVTAGEKTISTAAAQETHKDSRPTEVAKNSSNGHEHTASDKPERKSDVAETAEKEEPLKKQDQ